MLSEFLDSYREKFIDRNCLESYREQLVSLSKEFETPKLLNISYKEIEIEGVDTIYIDANRDILEQLDSIEIDSIFAITICGVVEFIPFEETLKIVSKSKELLSEGGVLIIQTLNPENIDLSINRDSILNIIPQHLLSSAVEFVGFSRYKILRTQESEYLKTQRYIDIEQLFSGASSRYAIVAQKGDSEVDIDLLFVDEGISFEDLVRGFEFREHKTQKSIQNIFNKLEKIDEIGEKFINIYREIDKLGGDYERLGIEYDKLNDNIDVVSSKINITTQKISMIEEKVSNMDKKQSLLKGEINLNNMKVNEVSDNLSHLTVFTQGLAEANHHLNNISIELQNRQNRLENDYVVLSQSYHSLSQAHHSLSQAVHIISHGCFVIKNCIKRSLKRLLNPFKKKDNVVTPTIKEESIDRDITEKENDKEIVESSKELISQNSIEYPNLHKRPHYSCKESDK